MALLLKKAFQGYIYYNDELSDPRTQDWFLIGSPWPGLTILGFYLYFVLNLGPRLMENRPAFKLDKLLVGYNAVQILLCLYLVYKTIIIKGFSNFHFKCEDIDYSVNEESMEICKCVYVYFVLKLVDLLDTVFFVLRKKNNQISFLHVYHHTGMVALGWGGVKYLAGGHSTFIGSVNSFVHVVMYTYYLLSALDPEYKKNVWWKKHITQLQIVQFLLMIWHFLKLLFAEPCNYPKWTVGVFLPQNIFMLILFVDFYRKAYLGKGKKKMHNNIIGNNINKDKSS